MGINPFKLFDPDYLFDPRPGSEFFYFWPLMALFIVVFVGSFKVKKRSVAARMRELLGLGILLTFLRDQNVPYLGMRLWILLIFVGALAYAIWVWKQSEKMADLKPVVKEREDHFNKYLPKKKRR